MIFNSFDFAVFLPLVFLSYWFLFNKNLRLQNFFLVVVSYIFYGWWDWRFLILLFTSSVVDYIIGIKLSKSEDKNRRKLLLYCSLFVNLGILGFFKYYNFFTQNFAEAFSFFGYSFAPERLNIILPVGISFYTFQTMSYSIDIYRKRLNATNDIISFFAYVGFFPQLVAGPIEKAVNFLPQFHKKRIFELQKASDGMRQILWGLFKKIVIADNCAVFVNDIFQNSADYSGSTLFFGGVLFYFQIYCDFSGYSDIAIGTGRLFGFNLMKNFDFPFFARTPGEAWRKWHISLTNWFRDYLLPPLGGYRGTWLRIKNTIIIFIVIGFWHGANWTFIVFGLLNAIYMLPEMLYKRFRIKERKVAKGKILPSLKELRQMIITFTIGILAMIFFRSLSVGDAIVFLKKIFSMSFFNLPEFTVEPINNLVFLLLLFILLILEWVQRDQEHGLDFSNWQLSKFLRWIIYYSIIIVIILYGGDQQDFIYFQF